MMPTKKKKSIRKTKKKVMRPTKRARGKTSPRKKKPVRKQKRTASLLAVRVSAVEVTKGIEKDDYDFGNTEVIEKDELDEHFPPDYGGSE